MPLTEHLSELRKRIVVPLVCIGLGFIATFYFSENIFEILSFPLKSELKLTLSRPFVQIIEKTSSPLESLVFLRPAEALWMHFKIAFVASLVLNLPLIFYQFWRYVSPGLLPREKKFFLPFIFSSTGLFLIGVFFCYLVVLPFALSFLFGYKTQNLVPMIAVGHYIDFSLKFILAFGLVFELPLIIVFLTKFGFVSPHKLSRFRKYAVLLAFVAAAILTPTPDAFNQTLMAGPIIILYEVGILLSKIIYRRKDHS